MYVIFRSPMSTCDIAMSLHGETLLWPGIRGWRAPSLCEIDSVNSCCAVIVLMDYLWVFIVYIAFLYVSYCSVCCIT